EGEHPAATQPFPTLPVPFTRQQFLQDDLRSFMDDRDSLRRLMQNAKTGSPYLPITDKMTIFFPGTDGGAQWGGAASDPDGILFIPAKEVPVYTTLKPVTAKKIGADSARGANEKLYTLRCASCHGEDLKGNHDGSIPPLADLALKMDQKSAAQVTINGRGMMPGFSHISEQERAAILGFLFKKKSTQTSPQTAVAVVPYHNTGYNRWYHQGYPVSSPPWGTLSALNLNTGQLQWQVPLGEYEELTAKGIPVTGTDNYGGPVVTAGGLIFIAATRDQKIRAFEKSSGRLLWQHDLPAAGYATPSTYMVDGRQYIVIACGGGKLNTKSGDQYVAFALPAK
ncbi:MAG: c-type cytochrome, partial [Sphingobacteriales bacterium]